ncbi:hypothetical protein TRIUR3_33234 [Triticum urartu]|uniref:Uncharacterized protein n=1 Tax=Triticum urartu TaxID=4572 RepID=M8AJB9_TRIUA|nr:hypothetical protein TRIUR3_33234 [Triticum urartu]
MEACGDRLAAGEPAPRLHQQPKTRPLGVACGDARAVGSVTKAKEELIGAPAMDGKCVHGELQSAQRKDCTSEAEMPEQAPAMIVSRGHCSRASSAAAMTGVRGRKQTTTASLREGCPDVTEAWDAEDVGEEGGWPRRRHRRRS